VSALQRCVCLSWQSWGQHVASWQFTCLKALNPIRVPKRMQHTLITSEICLNHRRVLSDSLQLRFGLCGWRCSLYANIPTWFKGRVSGIRGYGLGRLEGNGSLESVDSKCDSQYIRYIEQVVYRKIPDFKGCVSTRLDPCIIKGLTCSITSEIRLKHRRVLSVLLQLCLSLICVLNFSDLGPSLHPLRKELDFTGFRRPVLELWRDQRDFQ